MPLTDDQRRVLLFIVVSVSVVFGLSVAGQYSFLLFHSLTEAFSVTVAASIFLIGWNTDRFARASIFRPLGIGFLHVAFITTLHTLSYSGMGVFLYTTANLSTQLWILARFVETATLLMAPFIMRVAWSRTWIFTMYGVATACCLVLIVTGLFPVCWVDGALTPFKVASEYVIVTLLLVSAVYYWKHDRSLSRSVVGLVVLAIAFAIAAELSFTLYTDVTGPFNMLGHYLKLVSIYLVYRAFVSETLVRPYENLFGGLARANEMLRLTNKTVRHDIRNEVHKIELTLELISMEMKSPVLDEAQKGMKRLDDLLDSIAAIDTLDSMWQSAEEVGLEDLVRQAGEGSSLRINVTGSCSAIAGPPLISAIRNMIRNAEQHSGSESVDVEIFPEGEHCVIRIADTGKGIPADLGDKLFQEGAAFGDTAGTGLGLYIAKRIVTAYDGRIDVKDNVPRGTVFEIRLRRAESLGTERAQQEA